MFVPQNYWIYQSFGIKSYHKRRESADKKLGNYVKWEQKALNNEFQGQIIFDLCFVYLKSVCGVSRFCV